MSDALFDVRNVSFSYGEKDVLRDINLTFSPKKFYGLIGPNGSGKTTLLDLLIGNLEPASGSLSYKGRKISGYPRRELARELSLVPQDFSIQFSYTVLDVVLMGRHPYIPRFGTPSSHDLEVAQMAMAAIGIKGFENRFVTELSGGEKQRVVAARALAQETPVLILDEATSNLDICHTLEIFQVVQQRVRQKGDTVIAAIHDLNLAAAYCDEIIFLQEGRVFSAGLAEDVLTEKNIREVFGVENRVYYDEFSCHHQITFLYAAK
ncbi:MAG: ABC transporter ATP-binding protein [Desulfobulbaceae bacterium]|nr:ABC transporter ATP-binding protein [Desulfobulbaceae bacterium]